MAMHMMHMIHRLKPKSVTARLESAEFSETIDISTEQSTKTMTGEKSGSYKVCFRNDHKKDVKIEVRRNSSVYLLSLLPGDGGHGSLEKSIEIGSRCLTLSHVVPNVPNIPNVPNVWGCQKTNIGDIGDKLVILLLTSIPAAAAAAAAAKFEP